MWQGCAAADYFCVSEHSSTWKGPGTQTGHWITTPLACCASGAGVGVLINCYLVNTFLMGLMVAWNPFFVLLWKMEIPPSLPSLGPEPWLILVTSLTITCQRTRVLRVVQRWCLHTMPGSTFKETWDPEILPSTSEEVSFHAVRKCSIDRDPGKRPARRTPAVSYCRHWERSHLRSASFRPVASTNTQWRVLTSPEFLICDIGAIFNSGFNNQIGGQSAAQYTETRQGSRNIHHATLLLAVIRKSASSWSFIKMADSVRSNIQWWFHTDLTHRTWNTLVTWPRSSLSQSFWQDFRSTKVTWNVPKAKLQHQCELDVS